MSDWNSCYYVCNEEILAHFRLWKDAVGDQKSLIQSEFIKRLTFLVQSRISRYRMQPYYEDLLQEGKIGLMKAMDNFDPERGLNFFKYAQWHIKNKINAFLRWQKRTSKNVYIERNNETEDPYMIVEEKEERMVLRNIINSLPKIPKDIIISRYCQGSKVSTFEQIGNRHSLTKQRIQQIETKTIAKIKRENAFVEE